MSSFNCNTSEADSTVDFRGCLQLESGIFGKTCSPIENHWNLGIVRLLHLKFALTPTISSVSRRLNRVFLVLGERFGQDSRKVYQDVNTRMPSTADAFLILLPCVRMRCLLPSSYYMVGRWCPFGEVHL